jgi:hypothetical protein
LEVWVTAETDQIKKDREHYEAEKSRQRQAQYYENVVAD